MNKIKLNDNTEFLLKGDIEQTTRDGKVWSLRFEIIGYYSPEFLTKTFSTENIAIMKVLDESDKELLVLENYNTIITMQIYTHVTNIKESFVTIQMIKELDK